MKAGITLMLLCFSLVVNATLTVYPAGEGVKTIEDYSVEVRALPGGEWQEVAVYPVKVDEVVNARHTPRTASMAYFDFDG